MRKLAYVGLLLLLVGIACIVYGEVGLSNVKRVEVATSNDLVWNSTCNLASGKTYIVYIESNDDWGKAFKDGQITDPQPVNVTITSPDASVTRLQAFYYGLSTDNPMYQEGTPPAIVEVRYSNVDDNNLRVDASSGEIRFTVKQDGNYTVSVLKEGLWSVQPPNFFTFYEEVSENRNLYSLMAFAGGGAGTVGGVTFVVSVFRKDGTKRKKPRK